MSGRIPEGWRECKLGDVAEIVGGGTPKTNVIEYWNGEIPWITPRDLSNFNGRFISKGERNISEKGLINSSARILPKGTILLSTRAPVGYLAIAENQMTTNQGFRSLIPFKNTDNIFLFYLLKNNVEYLKSQATGTTFGELSGSVLGSLIFPFPPLPEQHAIASVIGSLDDKIDLLNRENQTLEQMAEAIFRQWFIEEANEKWEEGKLGDVLAVIESGKRPKGGIDPDLENGIPSIGAENINGIGHYDYSKTKLVNEVFFQSMKKGIIKDYDVLIYKDGAYVGRKGMFGLKYPYDICTVNEHVFILRANDKLNQFFLYFILEQEALSQLNSNSAQPGLNKEAIESLDITIPPKVLVEEFSNMVKPWIDKILINAKQIRTLEKLRGTLLPKLMSGEVRVKICDA